MAGSVFDGKVVLVTGGTGSFGNRFVARMLKDHKPKKLIVFSRDELKQSQMAARIDDPRIRFLLGDIRDLARLQRAFHGVNVVVHAAALKQVPALEYNPFEAVQTNIIGAENIINAAIDQGVEKVVALSTDKAVNPVNLYGATKLCFEKLFVAGNNYAGGLKTRFSCVRYGNVVGSRGSVVPLFLEKRATGVLPITHKDMTRFWITLDAGVDTVVYAATEMHGGEIFVPKIPSMKIVDLAKAVGPKCRVEYVGVRPGEKLHEALLTEEETGRTVDAGQYFIVKPQVNWWANANWKAAKAVPAGFRYSSDVNDEWLTPAQISKMVAEFA
jgi:UDP-N-acetylglucosamine 4,6-dehydratase